MELSVLLSHAFSSSLPHIIRAVMPTRYVGLFCPNGHFNVQDTYEVERVNAALLLHWIVNRQAELQCKKCRSTVSCQQSDVAHSNWRDGREPHYHSSRETGPASAGHAAGPLYKKDQAAAWALIDPGFAGRRRPRPTLPGFSPNPPHLRDVLREPTDSRPTRAAKRSPRA